MGGAAITLSAFNRVSMKWGVKLAGEGAGRRR